MRRGVVFSAVFVLSANSQGGATNPESNKDKQPTLADVLDEVCALRKKVALVKFDDARISKLKRLLNDNFMFRNDISPNGNHNAVNQGLSGSANHPMVDGKNDNPNGNQNGVNKGLSCSANDPPSTCSGANILDGEVAGALIGIHKVGGNNDSSNVNHNAVNKALSCSANDPMLRSTCCSPDMDNGEVVVAGIGIHKADGQNDIPNANDKDVNQVRELTCSVPDMEMAKSGCRYGKSQGHIGRMKIQTANENDVNQGIIGSPNDPMIPKLNDHPTSDIGVKVVHVDEFSDDFMDVLNDEESIPNYSLDDMKLQDEEEKLISTPALVNHQHVDELIDVHEDKTTMLQENVKDLSNKSQYVNVVKEDYKPCLGMVFSNVKAKEEVYPVAWRDVEKVYFLVNEPKKHWCLVELHISTGVVTFYDSLGWVCGNRRPWWRMMRRRLPQQLTLYLQEHEVLQIKGIAVETYKIKYMFPKVVRQADNYGDYGAWTVVFDNDVTERDDTKNERERGRSITTYRPANFHRQLVVFDSSCDILSSAKSNSAGGGSEEREAGEGGNDLSWLSYGCPLLALCVNDSSVISISSDVSVESVGSSFPRVILIGSISVEVPVAPEVGAAAVASPAGVLELDTHSSSEADPSESSPPPVSVAPMVLPFLCSDDSESDTEIPERHVSPTTSTPEIPTAPILPAPSAIVAPSSEYPLAPVVAPPGIRR
ncbi:phospholipase-like protein [Tanacetum coccineum]